VVLIGASIVIAVLAVAVGCGLTYVGLQRDFQRTLAELRTETERQLSALTGTLKGLETRVAELAKAPAIRPAIVPAAAPAAKVEAPAAKAAVDRKQEEVSPEIMVVIAAAVTAFLGKKVRIRSAKTLQSPYEIVNPWSQQGRVFVQASHNLRSR
jgi:methylmalonyl-CoA carboxyltransferase large subunit